MSKKGLLNTTPKWVAPCLYQRGGKIHARVRVDGIRTWLTTGTNKLSKATKVHQAWQEQQVLRKHGVEPKRHTSGEKKVVVGTLIDEYEGAGHPCAKRGKKEKLTILTEQKAFRMVKAFFGEIDSKLVSIKTCDEYHRWRMNGGYKWKRGERTYTSHAGTRRVDIELQALSNAFGYAVRQERIKGNPIAGRPIYHDSGDTRHCREFAPTPQELLRIKDHLEQEGFWVERDCIMFQAATGLRIGEALPLIWTAVDREAGLVAVKRLKKGINPWAVILPEMESLLDEMATRRGRSRLLFPSGRNPNKPLPYQTYQHRLKKTCAALGIRRIRTHGLRSYFVTAAREAGLPDTEIAALIGDKTVSIIATTYGDVLPEHLRNQARRIRVLLRPSLSALPAPAAQSA